MDSTPSMLLDTVIGTEPPFSASSGTVNTISPGETADSPLNSLSAASTVRALKAVLGQAAYARLGASHPAAPLRVNRPAPRPARIRSLRLIFMIYLRAESKLQGRHVIRDCFDLAFAQDAMCVIR